MSSNKTDMKVLGQDWVQKFHFENKIDLNLQMPSENESTKIEVDDIPIHVLQKLELSNSSTNATNNSNSSDSYLQSILSSSSPPTTNSSTSCVGGQTCACYKCQRQRRRAGINRQNPPIEIANNSSGNRTDNERAKPLSTNSPNRTRTPTSPVTLTDSPKMVSSSVVTAPFTPLTPLTPAPSPQPQEKKLASSPPSNTATTKRSNTVRKAPTLRSYEKHMPKPTYSQQDSIYRIEQEQAAKAKVAEEKARNISLSKVVSQQDNYKMAWKEDETGDDLLTSLVTFQTIFEEKDGNDGLSDLLEQRAQELKYQKLRELQEPCQRPSLEEQLPPRRTDCLTLSYRHGPRHNPLTLYHTMKMNGEQERMSAYNTAYKHCINSNSGLKSWVKKSRTAPIRESSKLIQSAQRPTQQKRSLLHPTRKNKVSGDDFLIWSSSSDNLNLNSNGSKKSIDMISSPIPLVHSPTGGGVISNANNQPTDVLSAAQALLPNQNLSELSQQQQKNRVPYEHIDTPSRPRYPPTTPPSSQSTTDFKDTSSISSCESASGTTSSYTSSKILKSRPGRLFSSLGRKTSIKSYSSSSQKAASIKSLEKVDEAHERVLDDLCRILPHIDRSQLSPYVYEANNDYMTALQLCKAAVISGKLS